MTRMLFAATAASVLVAGAGASAGASLRSTVPNRTARAALITRVNVTAMEYKFTLPGHPALGMKDVFTIT